MCIGLRPGTRSLVELDDGVRHACTPSPSAASCPCRCRRVARVRRAPAVSTRRARFIDVVVDEDQLLIEAGFQDSVG